MIEGPKDWKSIWPASGLPWEPGPDPKDPLAQRTAPHNLDDVLRGMVEAIVTQRLRSLDTLVQAKLAGRTDTKLNGFSDIQLIHELLARGWAVYKPRGQEPGE